MQTVKRRIAGADKVGKAALPDERHMIFFREAALCHSVIVVKWEKRQFKHNDRVSFRTNFHQQLIQIAAKVSGIDLTEQIVAADFKNDRGVIALVLRNP